MITNILDKLIDYVILTSDVTNSTTSFADVTGLSLPVLANTNYEFEFEVIFQGSTTGKGIALSVNGPASPTSVMVHSEIPTSLTAVSYQMARSYDTTTATTSVDTANANCYARCYGTLFNGANAGTLILRFRRNIGGGSVTVMTNSLMKMWRINPSN
jgi:hypothetical protein